MFLNKRLLGLYNINIVDNLVILHNSTEKISFTYDLIIDAGTKKVNRIQSLGTPKRLTIEDEVDELNSRIEEGSHLYK